MRLDLALKFRGLAPSRSKAQELIRFGCVECEISGQWQAIYQPNFDLQPHQGLRVKSTESLKYVSRAGLKLAGAIERLNLDVKGARVLDLGISTGGFADCLLMAGAAHVVGVDVGHGQLHPKLRQDSRVTLIEGLNARELSKSESFAAQCRPPFDLCVVDLSFISLTKVLAEIRFCLSIGARLLALVKPQFELGPSALNKKGVVKEASLYEGLQKQIGCKLEEAGFGVVDYFPSELVGQDGNQEFFVYAVVP